METPKQCHPVPSAFAISGVVDFCTGFGFGTRQHEFGHDFV